MDICLFGNMLKSINQENMKKKFLVYLSRKKKLRKNQKINFIQVRERIYYKSIRYYFLPLKTASLSSTGACSAGGAK